jgi:hypothetical protein
MSDSVAAMLAAAVTKVTKDYSKIKKKEERDQRQDLRLRALLFLGRSSHTTIRDAAAAVIPQAYQKASGGGHLPARTRQVMYAARPAIQEATGEPLKDTYFTQTLLPDYVREHPDETADWDVVYDARGHILEPHTNYQVGLGTLEVRKYLAGTSQPQSVGIERPTLNIAYPTRGPRNRYHAVLYIEKEGFLELLQRAQFAERYDLAIMSSKGMSTTAARFLIESLSDNATVYVLHDFDKSGFSILGTLTRDTRRYEYANKPKVIDLGLRLADVEQWNLQSEEVSYNKDVDPRPNLMENGATVNEVEFLCGSNDRHGNYAGQRVELNAFASDQFVEWLDTKLRKHKVKKVIPEEATLAKAWRRAAAIRLYQQIIDDRQKEVTDYAATLAVPNGLRQQVAKLVAKDPTLSWDKALEALLTSERGGR